MARVDPRMVEAIARARLQGRGPEALGQPHNDQWPPYKMYPDVYDETDLVTEPEMDGYNMMEPPERRYNFGPKVAQYQGQPLAPDVPSARDIRNLQRGDPEMRRRFEDYFGQESLNRADQGVGQGDKNYVPTPRPRPQEAPIGPSGDEYQGDESGMLPETYKTEMPRPEEAYSYMPGLKERIAAHILGPGVAREGKSDREPNAIFDQSFGALEGRPQGNIQDYRTMAIENLIKRGGESTQPPPEAAPEPSDRPEEEGMNLDDIIRKRIQEVQEGRYR